MDNKKLSIWEVSAGDIHKFVLADSMETMKQYFYIGNGGFIRLRPDIAITPEPEMEILRPKPLPPQKASDFTKLEKASLMIAQGMMANTVLGDNRNEVIADHSVSIAKAVLEETTKSTEFHDQVTENAKQCYEFAISVLEKIRGHFEKYDTDSPAQGHIEDKIEELKSLIK